MTSRTSSKCRTRASGCQNQKHSECFLTKAEARSTNSGGAGVGGGNSSCSLGLATMTPIYKTLADGASLSGKTPRAPVKRPANGARF